MKKCMINNQKVEAVQYIDPIPCPGRMVPREKTDKSIAEIKDLLKSVPAQFAQKQGVLHHYIFSIIDDEKSYPIYNENWVIKTEKNFFIVSDDIFQDMFTERESNEG